MISQEEIVRTTKNRKEETNSIIAEVENLQMDTLQLDDVLGQVELWLLDIKYDDKFYKSSWPISIFLENL